MIPANIAEKIKELELYTRRLMRSPLIGDHTAIVKGAGLEFDQLREYQMGDDVRFIDWNSTARMNKVLVKQFYEEKNRVILIALDISGSTWYGTKAYKQEAMAYLSGVLAVAGELAKDQVGLLLFSDKVHTYIPPGKGRKHTHCILQKLFQLSVQQEKTDINAALQYMAQLRKKNAMVFLISDFIQESNFETHLAVVSRMYDLIAIRLLHDYERSFPSVGLLTVQDSETGQEAILDTRNQRIMSTFLEQRLQQQLTLFRKYRIDLLEITDQQSPLPLLMNFFKKRKR